jgi:hypothetical protein
MTDVIMSSLFLQACCEGRVAAEREILFALSVGHVLELIPLSIACKRGLDLCEYAKAVERACFEFLERYFIQRWLVVADAALSLPRTSL